MAYLGKKSSKLIREKQKNVVNERDDSSNVTTEQEPLALAPPSGAAQ